MTASYTTYIQNFSTRLRQIQRQLSTNPAGMTSLNIPDIETGADMAKTLHVNAIINNLQNITSQIEVRLHVPMSTIEANLFLRRQIDKGRRCRNALKQVLIEITEEGEIDLNEAIPVAPPENRINIDDVASSLNTDQREIHDMYMNYFRNFSQATRNQQILPQPLRLLLHDGPGAGISFVTTAIVNAAATFNMNAVCTAYTGIAASSLPNGRTMHNFLRLGAHTSQDRFADSLNPEQIFKLRNTYSVETLRLVVVDEISSVPPGLLFLRSSNRTECVTPSTTNVQPSLPAFTADIASNGAFLYQTCQTSPANTCTTTIWRYMVVLLIIILCLSLRK